jgi:hypothetical protein
MECRCCGACCIVISISSPIPGMPNGKPTGVRCIHLTENNLCSIFDHPSRPKVCGSFPAMEDICGKDREEAFKLINELELQTA